MTQHKKVTDINAPYLPARELLATQSTWLQAARGRILRRVGIARRQSVLDLGAGYGSVTPELVRRAGGAVIALDRAIIALQDTATFASAGCVAGDGRELPFADGVFDLVFCQLTLLWVKSLASILAEVWRVLMPGGVFIALEPDYGGMIEYPPEIATRDLWLAALTRAGADPYLGRRLPGLLTACGFDVHIGLLETLLAPDPLRFTLLRGLPLTDTEVRTLNKIERNTQHSDEPYPIAHLPFFLITAIK